ncbi:hypothetical protein AAKU55_005669, partial [Oxalobacteraceae bacterium GrIS 1.11]
MIRLVQAVNRRWEAHERRGFVLLPWKFAEDAPKPQTQKNPARSLTGFFHITSLTITYFHTGCSTI